MKLTHYIYILTILSILTACKDDIVPPAYTVGAADNVIELSAGISEGGSGVQTRAAGGYDDIDDSNHGKHLAFTTGTKAALRLDGTWLGHTPSTSVSLPTTATIGAIKDGTNNKHNTLSISPVIYWDDFGTADPANMNPNEGNGRAKGLTIYGAAVNGVTSAPTIDGTTGKQWTALSWNVGTPSGTPSIIDQSGTDYWKDQDLLTTNNVREGGPDATYKFDEKTSGKLLEFTHAMTKITVNLTAGTGFADSKFVDQPTVTLLGFNYTGDVNIVAKTSIPTASTTTNIQAHFANYKEESTATEWTPAPSTWTESNQTQFDALVFPGNTFENTKDILKIEADGNIYYVNATMINEAMNTAGDVDNTFKQAKNYIFNIIINKTSIDVTATIKDWDDVSAENDNPIINISKCYGQTTTTSNGLTDFAKDFTFYRSTAVGGSYLADNNKASVTYAEATGYTMTPQLYWPDHTTHYFFRGVWPVVGSTDGLTPSEKMSSNGVEVANCAYSTGTYPSDLMIGMPRTSEGNPDETCKAGHKDGENATAGICATDALENSTHDNEGLVHMNFQYAMSQVIVELKTNTAEGAQDKVTFDANTKVEIVGGYKDGSILLSDQSSYFTGKTVDTYTMSNAATNDYDTYHDAIIPQPLTNGEGENVKDLKFRITVGDGAKTDVYETVLGIKNIKVMEGGVEKDITSWEPGKKYTYTLTITKTDIKVTATLKDWVEVEADQPIWF